MELKITTLIENQPDERGELAWEHGLSLLIEFDGQRLLFDTGQTGAFADNAAKLGVSLSELDAVILSHGHYDHSGGVPRLLPLLSSGTPVFTGEGFFRKKYKRIQGACTCAFQYNGNPFPKEIFDPYPVRLITVDTGVFRLTPRIVLLKGFASYCPFEQPNPRFCLGSSSGFLQDVFDDEIALGLLTSRGLVLVAGCAHPGIVSMLHAAAERTGVQPCAVVGGTHLTGARKERIADTLEAFRKLGLSKIAVSHCTGREAEALLREAFPEQFFRNSTGCVLQL